MEPLLFYVLHRASNEIADPAKLATFKTFLLDEAWLFIKNETIRIRKIDYSAPNEASESKAVKPAKKAK